MKPIPPADRRVANLTDAFTPFAYPDGVALGDSKPTAMHRSRPV